MLGVCALPTQYSCPDERRTHRLSLHDVVHFLRTYNGGILLYIKEINDNLKSSSGYELGCSCEARMILTKFDHVLLTKLIYR